MGELLTFPTDNFCVPTSPSFFELCAERRSMRGYLPTPVAPEVLEQLLVCARKAPSGANLQPGSFTWVRGAAREALSADLVRAWRGGEAEVEDYDYFPKPMPMTLRKRQVAAAQALYGALGVAREDRAGRDAQFERNFRFFDAPVALIVTLEHGFGSGGYMDLGMALYGLMLAAQAQGLASCAIGAMAKKNCGGKLLPATKNPSRPICASLKVRKLSASLQPKLIFSLRISSRAHWKNGALRPTSFTRSTLG